MTPSLGVAVTRHNRHTLGDQCIREWRRHLPDGVPLFVIDDASNPPILDADHRFETNVGIATAKNKSIELLMDAGVEHLVLADDDCWPITPDWWQPYVESPIPHLMYLNLFEPRATWSDGRHFAFKRPRGALLYYERRVIDRVGGMRTEFPRWGDEHVEHSRRIHNAGLTPHRYMDVVGSSRLWVNDRTLPSSVPLAERQSYAEWRARVMAKYDGSSEFVAYR